MARQTLAENAHVLNPWNDFLRKHLSCVSKELDRIATKFNRPALSRFRSNLQDFIDYVISLTGEDLNNYKLSLDDAEEFFERFAVTGLLISDPHNPDVPYSFQTFPEEEIKRDMFSNTSTDLMSLLSKPYSSRLLILINTVLEKISPQQQPAIYQDLNSSLGQIEYRLEGDEEEGDAPEDIDINNYLVTLQRMADKLPEDFDYPSEVYDNWISDIVQDANFISNVYKQPLYSKILKAFIDGIPEYCNESFYVPTRSEDNYNYFGLFNLVDIFMEGTSERSNRKFKRQLDSLLETYPDTNTPDAAALAQEIIRLWDSQT